MEPKERKRIGILGGISHESTLKYYELIMQKYYERHSNYYYPEVVIFSLDFQRYTDLEEKGREGMAAYAMEGIRSLEAAGADLIIMAANSIHSIYEDIKARAKVPVLSLVELTAGKAKELGLKRLLLLGIRYTMQSDFYQKACESLGIEVITPKGPEQDEVNSMIFGELVRGIIKEGTRDRLLDIIRSHDCDGVILGCTELPNILTQDTAPDGIIFLDTVKIHTDAALDTALSS